MHLCGVVTRFAQDVDNLPDGVFRLVGPFYYFHDGFVSRLSAFQLFFGDENVIGKRTVFRHQEGVGTAYFQCAYKGVVGTFQYFYHFSFGFAATAFGVEGNAYFIIVHGVCRITLGHEYRVTSTFGNERILSIAFTLESTCHFHSMIVQFIFAFLHFGDVIIQ